jgi:hypothetical protein
MRPIFQKICLNETYNKVIIDINLSDAFPIYSVLKQGHTLSLLFFTLALEYAIRKDWNRMVHIRSCSMLVIIYWVKT